MYVLTVLNNRKKQKKSLNYLIIHILTIFILFIRSIRIYYIYYKHIEYSRHQYRSTQMSKIQIAIQLILIVNVQHQNVNVFQEMRMIPNVTLPNRIKIATIWEKSGNICQTKCGSKQLRLKNNFYIVFFF